MSEYTNYYNLKKPKETDYYSVEDANNNNDMIDTILYNKLDKKAGKDLSTNDFTNEYKKKLDSIEKVYKFKGNVNTYTELSTISASNGDVYNVLDEGSNYAWNGTEWVELGFTIDMSKFAYQDDVNEIKSAVNENAEKIDNLETQMVTTEGTNLDDYTTEGRYYFSTSYTPTNLPAGSNGLLEVFVGPNFIKQIWYRHGSANNNDYQTFVRTKTSGVWSEWQQYAIKRSAITAYLSTSYTIENNNSPFINIDTIETILGEDLELQGNAIICKRKGVVEVSGSVGVKAPNVGGNLQLRTYKNKSTMISNLQVRPAYANDQSFQIPTKIISVDANTPINLYVGNWTGQAITINGVNALTFLTVKYID